MAFRLRHNPEDFVYDSFGYNFSDVTLLNKALETTGLLFPESNQRLAMLGDACIKLVILDEWHESGSPKGKGNDLVSTLGSNANLASVARDVNLAAHIVLNPGHRGRVSDKIMATTVEAILGAIYLDSGKNMQAVSSAMNRLGLSTEI